MTLYSHDDDVRAAHHSPLRPHRDCRINARRPQRQDPAGDNPDRRHGPRTVTNVAGSCGATPNKSSRITPVMMERACAAERASPADEQHDPPSRRISRCTRPLSAPRLMRMPISFVRALTENASTPPMPTAAMITASMPNAEISTAFSRCGETL